MRVETYSIYKSTEGGYTVKELKQLCKTHGARYLSSEYSCFVGHRQYRIDISNVKDKSLFETAIFARG